jgi:hypothetical protein
MKQAQLHLKIIIKMRKTMKTRLAAVTVFTTLVLFTGVAHATPSSTFWTPMTTDIQPYGVLHIGVDNYFTVLGKDGGSVRSFSPDIGPEIGVLPFDKIQMEVGLDYMGGADYPWFFNAKIGSSEDAWFKGSPALQLGIFNVGTKGTGPSRTDYDVGYLVIGKSIDPIGSISVGPYIGNHSALVSSDGAHKNDGFMVAFDHGFIPVKDKDGKVDYNKLVFAADYASGKNAIGGGGFGLYYFFTKDISLLTGPVWFNDQGINGKWKWSVQLDINTAKLW